MEVEVALEEELSDELLTEEEQRALCVGDLIEVFWEGEDVEWCEGQVTKARKNPYRKTLNPNPKLK